MDPLHLLEHFFATVVLCDTTGNIVSTCGKPLVTGNILHEPSLKSIKETLLEALKGQAFETLINSADSQRCRVKGFFIGLPSGEPGLAVGIEEPTEPFSRLRRDRMATPEYDFIIQNMRQGFWQLNSKGEIESANEYLAHWLEATPIELIGQPAARYILHEETEGPARFESEFLTISGIRRRAIVVRSQLVSPRGRPLGHVDIITDITAEHALRTKLVAEVQKMSKLAKTDALTGVANRIEFEESLRLAQASPDPFAVVSADLDLFKEVNDQYGHAMGDATLIELARRLKGSVRDSDLVARLGGDEFAVLIPSTNKEVAREVVDRIESRLSFTIQTDTDPLPIGVSVGWAHSDDFRETIAAASDRDMYRQKRKRKLAKNPIP